MKNQITNQREAFKHLFSALRFSRTQMSSMRALDRFKHRRQAQKEVSLALGRKASQQIYAAAYNSWQGPVNGFPVKFFVFNNTPASSTTAA